MRALLVTAALCLLAGCQQLEEWTLSETQKINRAFPLPTELAVVRASVADSLAAQPELVRGFNESFEQLLGVRALTCRSATTISRFDSVASVRNKLTDKDCFKKQDAELATWLGLRRLAWLAAQPPLKPLQGLPAKALIQSVDNVTAVSVATKAGVALARTGNGKFATLDLTGGKVIHQFNGPGDVHRPASVAPNGRIAALPISNRAVHVVELETGATIWTSDKYTDLLAWLPEVEAVVLAETGGRKAALVDLRNGQSQPYVADERGIQWAMDAPGEPGRKLVGSAGGVSVVDHARKADGTLGFEVKKQWTLQARVSANTPLLMRGGKLLVYMAHPDLGWLDLESGQQGTWVTQSLRIHNVAKFDENQVAFFGQLPPPGLKLLNVEQLTIASVPDVPNEGYPVSLAPRGGHARNVNGTLVVYTQLQPHDPQPLDKVLADANLQEQLRKVDAAQRTELQASGRTMYGAAEIATAEAEAHAASAAVQQAEARGLHRTNRPQFVELLARQVRMMNVASGMRDGLPRHVVERTRAGEVPHVIPGHAAASPVGQSAASRAAPMLADVPANAEVVVLGVYEGEQDKRRPGQPASSARSMGTVNVTLGSGAAPLVLVLSSYEPVKWVVSNPGGRRVAAVLMSSYHASEVSGLAGVPVTRMGQQYAYKLESPEYLKLKELVGRYVAAPIRGFQGGYQGKQFAVGG
ncbi:MAG: hypothetical protein HY854_09630 [Burkholderiales bacterium]|nr:hypothetical protein [Burkholderiales bacterium]